MATEASTAVPALPLSGQMVRKSCPWDAAEIHCAGCGRRVSRAAGNHHDLQCGHAFCELCLLITEEYSTITCPDCEIATTINMRQGCYPIDGCIKEDSSMEKLQPQMIKNCSQDFRKAADPLNFALELSTSTHRTLLSSTVMAV